MEAPVSPYNALFGPDALSVHGTLIAPPRPYRTPTSPISCSWSLRRRPGEK